VVKATEPRILAIGFGNPGRLDDGLGPALAEILERQSLAGVTVMADYQLSVEDAAAIAEHDAVVFIDASVDGPAPFRFERVPPVALATAGFTSHVLEAPTLMALARDLFGADAVAYMLGIRGYAFDDFGEGLSAGATANLAAALAFLLPVLRGQRLAAAAWNEDG